MMIWTANVTEEHIPLFGPIKEAGFDGVELPLFAPDNYPAAKIRKALEEQGLAATICAVVPVSLAHQDSVTRRKAAEFVKKTLAVSAEIGAKLIAGPLHSPVGYLPGRRRTADEWKWLVESYQQITPVLDEYGLDIAIEPLNRFETYMLNTAADGVALCEAIGHKRVGLLIDTFHSNIEEKNVAEAYRIAGPYLKHVHTCENDRGIPGSGHIEWHDVFETLRGLRYDGWLTIESFGFNIKEISAAAAIWRDLAPTPEAIAFEGLHFLKRHWQQA